MNRRDLLQQTLGFCAFAASNQTVLANSISTLEPSNGERAALKEDWLTVQSLVKEVDRTRSARLRPEQIQDILALSEYLSVSDRINEASILLSWVLDQINFISNPIVRQILRDKQKIQIAVSHRHNGALRQANQLLMELKGKTNSRFDQMKVLAENAYGLFRQGRTTDASIEYSELAQVAKVHNAIDFLNYAELGVGLIAKERGNFANAIKIFNELLENLVSQGDQNNLRRRGFIHGNLGAIYKTLGEFQKAKVSFQNAVKLSVRADPLVYRTAWIDGLASTMRLTGDHLEAKALILEQFLPFVFLESKTYFARRELALCHVESQAFEEAEFSLKQAIAIRITNNILRKIADYFADLASIQVLRKNWADVIEVAQEGLGWAERPKDADEEAAWKLHFSLFVAYKALLQPELALLFGKRAIEIVQEIRKSLHELDDITQRAFLRRVESVYAEVAAYCFAQNRFFTAEAILLLQRQRELNDLTLRNEQSPETRLLSNDELGTHKNLGSLTQENLQSIIELRRLESFPEGGRSESQRQSLKELTEKVGSFKQSSQKLLQLLIRASLRDSRAQGRGETEAVSTLTILSGGGFKRLALLVNEASPATAGITFVSTDHNLTTMVTLQGGTNTALLPTLNLTSDLSFATLREEIVKARVACQSNKGKPEEHLKKLYQYLIEPINKFLLGLGVKHLIIQATGILKNIPFAALWDGESFLVERFQIAQYTGHESPEISILSPATDRAAAFAVSLATNGFPELRAAEGEARSIIRTAQNTSGVFEGILNLNEKFTESALNKALQERYAIVHIASHFKFLRQDPANSFLIVGSGSNITLNQLATKRMNAVKLAVLSACQTGVNPTDDLERGHIEGLGTALQQAGAKNVVATLWAILDTSSADLMFNFYQALDQLNFKSVASALRQAQLQMITTKTKSTNVHNKPDLSHPFHWAGFVLMGNSVG